MINIFFTAQHIINIKRKENIIRKKF